MSICTRIQLVASTNWPPSLNNPDPSRLLAPLGTTIGHIECSGAELVKLVLLGSGAAVDHQYCVAVRDHLFKGQPQPKIDFRSVARDDPAEISQVVSTTAVDARNSGHEIWIDLTSGPKARAAIVLGAASALPDAKIVCCESIHNKFEVREIPSLEQYNTWLGPHGLLVRNYKREIEHIRDMVQQAEVLPTLARLSDAVVDLLAWNPSVGNNDQIGPRVDLTILAEWISNVGVPKHLLKIQNPIGWQARDKGKKADEDIRRLATSECIRAAARSSQALYQLRCLFSHPAQWTRAEVLLFLDLISYLIEILRDRIPAPPVTPESHEGYLYLALDGDDVGRLFEERLAEANTLEMALSLRSWSMSVQNKLSQCLQELSQKYQAAYLAGTGDGFLVVMKGSRLRELADEFRPRLIDATVSVGLGPSAKDAWVALKLCKARNRGGGLYFSLADLKEEVLWSAPEKTTASAIVASG